LDFFLKADKHNFDLYTMMFILNFDSEIASCVSICIVQPSKFQVDLSQMPTSESIFTSLSQLQQSNSTVNLSLVILNVFRFCLLSFHELCKLFERFNTRHYIILPPTNFVNSSNVYASVIM